MRDDVTRERVRIPTARGALGGELAYATDRPTFVCVAFSPHPHMGGTAENPVVVAICDAIAGAGGICLSFDYAGVGASEGSAPDVTASLATFWATGHAPEDPGMVADGRAAVRWLRDQTAEVAAPLCLAGYSFGAHVAAQCLDAERPAAIAAVAPTVRQHDFTPLIGPLAPPTLVVSSDDDFATAASDVAAFLASMARPPVSLVVPGASHFFRGVERDVASTIADFFLRFAGAPSHAPTPVTETAVPA